MADSEAELLQRAEAKVAELVKAGHGELLLELLEQMKPPSGHIDVQIDQGVVAAARAEAGRVGLPQQLVLLRWILNGAWVDAEQRAARLDS